MINYFTGKLSYFGTTKYLVNDYFGIEVEYNGNRTEGNFFVVGYYDENIKTYKYFIFDELYQKKFYSEIIKISGIGPKTAFHLSGLDKNLVKKAVDDFDPKFFQAVPGVGPKTAKRILVEMKNTFSKEDIDKLEIDEKILKDIISAMNTLGYENKKIKSKLTSCPIEFKKSNISIIIKWLIDNI